MTPNVFYIYDTRRAHFNSRISLDEPMHGKMLDFCNRIFLCCCLFKMKITSRPDHLHGRHRRHLAVGSLEVALASVWQNM